MAKKTLQELEIDLKHLRSQVEGLVQKVEQATRIAALEQCNKMAETLDQRIDARFRIAFVVGGFVLAILGGLGFLGVRSLVPSIVKESIGASTADEIRNVLAHVRVDAAAISTARQASTGQPLIVLQTDYGSANYYMGRLKGVIYGINPHARVETITAEILDFDRLNAAWTLWRASKHYPSGTIFVVITSPGGLSTRPTVIATRNGQLFVGPDNGCFDMVVQEYGLRRSYTIASPELSPKEYKDLFGGADLFGPTAAHLSLGYALDKVGPASDDYSPKLPEVRRDVRADRLLGTIMDIDKYGNVTSNLTEQDLVTLGVRRGESVRVTVQNTIIQVPFKETYGNVSKDAPVLLVFESLVQLAINEGNFAREFEVSRGSEVSIQR